MLWFGAYRRATSSAIAALPAVCKIFDHTVIVSLEFFAADRTITIPVRFFHLWKGQLVFIETPISVEIILLHLLREPIVLYRIGLRHRFKESQSLLVGQHFFQLRKDEHSHYLLVGQNHAFALFWIISKIQRRL